MTLFITSPLSNALHFTPSTACTFLPSFIDFFHPMSMPLNYLCIVHLLNQIQIEFFFANFCACILRHCRASESRQNKKKTGASN
jgi:hypothetical protein